MRGFRGALAVALVTLAACSGGGAATSTLTTPTAVATTDGPAPTSTSAVSDAVDGDEPVVTAAPATADPGDGDAPGAIVTSRPLGAAGGGTATFVEYASRSVGGAAVVVSGLVVRPDGEPPPGGFPILSWAHGTTGIADACAPSQFGPGAIPGLQDWLSAGYVVAATDYEGLGTAGIHPYLVAESEARSVLDAASAARALLGHDVVGTRLAVAGHSQGGHAALAAAEWAGRVAPDLDLVGTVAIAPAADLTLIVPGMFASALALTFGVYVAESWPAVFADLASADLLTAEGQAVAASTADGGCVAETFGRVATRSRDDLVAVSPTDDPEWVARIAQNTIHPDDVAGPVLVAQGGQDPLVLPLLSDALVEDLCAAGVPTTHLVVDDADHGTIVSPALAAARTWLTSIGSGGPAPSDC